MFYFLAMVVSIQMFNLLLFFELYIHVINNFITYNETLKKCYRIKILKYCIRKQLDRRRWDYQQQSRNILSSTLPMDTPKL